MSDFIDIHILARAVADAGLDVSKESDFKLFKQAVDEYDGDNINADLPLILAKAASNKDGVQLLSDYNDSHPLGQTDGPTPKHEETKPMRDRDGWSILEEYNRNNPL